MKILFAADMSFNYMPGYPGDEAVKSHMAKTAEKFKEADFSIVNLENIFGNKEDFEPIPKCGPNLISSDDFVEYIKALNPSVVGLANNHTGDFGEGAVFHTFDVLERNGYPYIGAGKNIEEAYKPFICEKDGIKVGIIAVCENEFGGAKKDKAGSAGYNLARLSNELKKLEKENIKSVVYFHGGNETNPFPSPGKKELYRHFIDMGASAVVAMHTHCPQGYETYNGCPIIYSMSNFYFPADRPGDQITWFYGYMTELNFSGDKTEIKTIPYRFDFEGIHLLEGDDLEFFNEYLAYLSEVIADDEKLGKFFDAWCARFGYDYATNHMHFSEDLMKDNSWEVAGKRNLFSCEAHTELLRGFLTLCYENRLEEAKEYLKEIEILQKFKLKKA